MIKSIHLTNIQSHKDSTLEFSPGINCLIGSSNQGKTSILRALNWVRYNRPLGIDTLASHWAVNDKGNLTDSISVKLINDFGTVERKRTKNENQYIVDDEVLNVVKSDVPDQVENILHLTETNIQNQQDAPFLLSATSGKVAEYLNRIVRLDMIDKVLSNAESKRRKCKQEIESIEKSISADEKKLEEYDWLDTVEKLLIKYERVQSKNKELKNQLDKLYGSVSKYESLIDKNYDFNSQNKIIDKIDKLYEKNNKSNNICNSIEKQIENYGWIDKVYPDFSRQKKAINDIFELDDKYVVLRNRIQNSIHLYHDYQAKEEDIENNSENIAEYKKQLPKICPVCGQPWDYCKEM